MSVNLYPKYREIDIRDTPDDLLVEAAKREMALVVSKTVEEVAFRQKVNGIMLYYADKKVLSEKQRKRVEEFLLSIPDKPVSETM